MLWRQLKRARKLRQQKEFIETRIGQTSGCYLAINNMVFTMVLNALFHMLIDPDHIRILKHARALPVLPMIKILYMEGIK